MSSNVDDIHEGVEKILKIATRANAELAAGASQFFDALFKQQRDHAQHFDELKADIARGSRLSNKPRRRPL